MVDAKPSGCSEQPATGSGTYSGSHKHTPLEVSQLPWPAQSAGHNTSSHAAPAKPDAQAHVPAGAPAEAAAKHAPWPLQGNAA
jgi:hypothetical protein